jgi:hypothetical protein
MPYDDEGGRSRLNPGELDQTDRILLAVAAALWLAALGAAVAAIVALVDLGTAHSTTAADSNTPWLLYTVIAVSAAVIVGAVPLLIRARRSSLNGTQQPATARPAAPARSGFGDPVEATTKLRSLGGPAIRRHPTPPASSRLGFPAAAVDRIWLRSSAVTAAAIGGATTLVCVGTYLLATEHDTAAWIAYGVAGLVTVAMSAVPWFYLRELRSVLA